LYVLEPTAADTVVEVLIGQMRRMAFANVRFARSLILAMGPSAVPALTRHLNDPLVLGVLGAMKGGAGAAVPALQRAVSNGNVEIAATLAAIGTPEAVSAARPVLLRALAEHHSPHLKMAVVAVGELGAEGGEAAEPLRRLLTHRDRDVRLYAASALADVGHVAEAATALGDLAVDTTVHNRHLAVSKLGLLGAQGRPAVPRLIELLRASDARRFGERAEALIALQRIDPADLTVRQAILTASGDPQVRAELIRRGVQIPPN
jgi:HEAT repeat protein